MSNQVEDNENKESVSTSKVGKLLEDYEMEGIGKELENRWLGKENERQSLRYLAKDFNQRLLKKILKGSGQEPLEGEVKLLYQTLNGDEISRSDRLRAETRLEKQDIDVQKIKEDFVSHQAIHTYLTEVRGANLDTKIASNILEHRKESIQRLRNRLIAMVERNIENLRNTNRISIGRFEVIARVTVHCKDCGNSFDISELFNQGNCDC